MSHEALRNAMVELQLVRRGISDAKVLAAFRKVPRHEFVTAQYTENSYDDYPLPIGSGQTISQPYMVALMTELLALKGQNEKVLEVGAGSGYQAAILAEIAGEVYTIERFPELAAKAGQALAALGYKNFSIKTGDGTLGWPEYAPYDAIIVTAGSPGIPESLARQLKDGGRLIIPVGSPSQILTVVEKREGKLTTREVCGCVFVPLIGKEGWY